jgi:hypothetical protein
MFCQANIFYHYKNRGITLMKNTHVFHICFTCGSHVNHMWLFQFHTWTTCELKHTCKNPHVNHMWITCDCSNSTCVSHVGFYMCIFRKGNYSFIILDTTVFLQFIKHLICLLGQDIFEFYFIFRIRSFSTHDHDPIPILKSTTMTARRDSWWMGFIEKWNYDIAAASTALFERNRTFFQLDMATIGLLNDQNLMRYWIIDTYSFASATSSALFAFVAFRALDKRDDNKFTFFL